MFESIASFCQEECRKEHNTKTQKQDSFLQDALIFIQKRHDIIDMILFQSNFSSRVEFEGWTAWALQWFGWSWSIAIGWRDPRTRHKDFQRDLGISDPIWGSTGLYVYISSILAVNDPWMQTWVGTSERYLFDDSAEDSILEPHWIWLTMSVCFRFLTCTLKATKRFVLFRSDTVHIL